MASFVQRSYLRKADIWISYLLLATILSEVFSILSTYLFNNNMYVYHIHSAIQLFTICLYFSEQIDTLKRTKVGIAIASIGVCIAILNAIFLQNLNTLNSIFLLYEGFAIIGLCLFAFYELV